MPIPSAMAPGIQAATSLSQASDDPTVAKALDRLAHDLRKSLHSGSAVSPSECSTIVEALRRIKGTANAELRIGCLIDLAQCLYLMGAPFLAIDPARQASELASNSGMKSLER